MNKIFKLSIVILFLVGCNSESPIESISGEFRIFLINQSNVDLLNPNSSVFKKENIRVFYSSTDYQQRSETYLDSLGHGFAFVIGTSFGRKGSIQLPEGNYEIIIYWDYLLPNISDTLRFDLIHNFEVAGFSNVSCSNGEIEPVNPELVYINITRDI